MGGEYRLGIFDQVSLLQYISKGIADWIDLLLLYSVASDQLKFDDDELAADDDSPRGKSRYASFAASISLWYHQREICQSEKTHFSDVTKKFR
jgi:hypothetical protein